MTRKRIVSVVSGALALATALALYTAVSGTESSHALQAADQRAAVTPPIREAVERAIGSPASPVAPDAASRIRHVFTPADGDLPAFFSIPTKDGGSCLVSSDTVISSCLRSTAEHPGTITIADDSQGDDEPPYVYGLIRPDIKLVEIDVDGVSHSAGIGHGFYLFKLADPASRVEDVSSVSFTLGNGSTITRSVNG